MPGIVPHSHAEGSCPVTGATSHAYCPPQPDDKRAPCPALNTLANHGYLPRDGKQIDAAILIRALEEGYGLSPELAYFISYGGYFLLGQSDSFQLDDLARHNNIEHDASLIHDDARPRDEYAPLKSDSAMWQELVKDLSDGKKLTTFDAAKARVRREAAEVKAGKEALDSVHAEIARGEMAIALGMFSDVEKHEDGIPLETLRKWMKEEKLPEGWKPTHVQGLWDTIQRSKQIRNAMDKIRASEKEKEQESEDHLKLVEAVKL